MTVFHSADFAGHEQVVFACNPESGMRSLIAVHSTALGPAIGGCRIRPYESEAEALHDVLRLSQGMSYKAAIAGVPFGGGKMVVIGDPRRNKTPALLRAIGIAIEHLGGRYVTGEDVGTTVEDMAAIKAVTNHVMGAPEHLGGSGDPSPRTALGCFAGIEASVSHRLGRSGLDGVRVAVQGLGNVGWNLCCLLAEARAHLLVTDVDQDLVKRAVKAFAAKPMQPDAIYAADADVFAPCALGAVVNDDTIPAFKVAIIAGGANNQLASDVRHAPMLRARGILYAPDYVINAGGMIQLAYERAGLDCAEVDGRVRAIGETLSQIYRNADDAGAPTSVAARELADKRLQDRGRSAG